MTKMSIIAAGLLFAADQSIGELAAGKCMTDVTLTEFRIADTPTIGMHQSAPSLFKGVWYARNDTPTADVVDIRKGQQELRVHSSGHLSSVDSNGEPGAIPTINGSRDFEIEVCSRIEGGDKYSFPAIWLLPLQHNKQREARYEEFPKDFESWVEIDIDEGGFGVGPTGTLHNWWGIYPNFHSVKNTGNISNQAIDRTKINCFTVKYFASNRVVRWLVNGMEWTNTKSEYAFPIMRMHDYFLIISHQYHKRPAKPYILFVSKIRVKQC